MRLSPIAVPPVLAVLAGIVLAAVVALVEKSDTLAQDATKYPAIDAKKHADYVEKLSEKVSIEMIAIPGGSYLMGTPEGEKGRGDNEGPRHLVTVTPFWMAKFETTWEAF